MLELSGQVLDVMVVLLLAVVGSLVLWLHFRLHQMRSAEKKMILLSESLNESLRKANRGLFEFSRVVREEGPKLEKEVFDAGQTVQDLDFMLSKAERLLKRMDDAFDMSESIIDRVDGGIKADEKSTLLGQRPQAKTQQRQQQVQSKRLQPQGSVPTNQKVATPKTSSKSDLSEKDIEKKLERELLTGLLSDVSKEEKKAKAEEVEPKRMASPKMGAMAYGGQVVSASMPNTDAEKELLKALEGRL